MNRDLTCGQPSKVLLAFCMPLFASVVFQQLYNIADSLIAGRMIGSAALAAVGNSYEITLIFIAFAFGCNIGCSVVTSQLFGAKQYGALRTAVSTAMIAFGGLCLVLMGAGLIFGDALLRQINTPSAIFADSKLYLDIYLLGFPFVMFYNISTGIFSAMGDSKTPLWFLAGSSVANIGMDALFVGGFHMGVDGVAWATFLCQGVSCVLALAVVIRRLRSLPAEGEVRWFSKHLLWKIARIAIPSILQQSFISVGNIIIQGVINGFGQAVIAGYAGAIKLNNMVITSLTTLANGISNFTAQNLGAGQPDRVRQGFRAGLRLVWMICVPVIALYWLCTRSLMMLFLNGNEADALQAGLHFLRIVAPFYGVIAAKLVADGCLRGAGKMKPFMLATLTDFVLRVLLALLLSKTRFGSDGIWMAWPIGWVISAVLSVLFYRAQKWEEWQGN